MAFCALSMMPMPRGWRNRVRYQPVYRAPYVPGEASEEKREPEPEPEPATGSETEPETESATEPESEPEPDAEPVVAEEGEHERKEEQN